MYHIEQIVELVLILKHSLAVIDHILHFQTCILFLISFRIVLGEIAAETDMQFFHVAVLDV